MNLPMIPPIRQPVFFGRSRRQAPFDFAPFDSAQGRQGKQGRRDKPGAKYAKKSAPKTGAKGNTGPADCVSWNRCFAGAA